MNEAAQLRTIREQLEAQAEQPILCALCGGEMEVRWGRHSRTWAVHHPRAASFDLCAFAGYSIRNPDRDTARALGAEYFGGV